MELRNSRRLTRSSPRDAKRRGLVLEAFAQRKASSKKQRDSLSHMLSRRGGGNDQPDLSMYREGTSPRKSAQTKVQ